MSHNKILEQMGIQQWRLRQNVDLSRDTIDEIPKDIEIQPVSQTSVEEIAPQIKQVDVKTTKEFTWLDLDATLSDQKNCPSCAQSKPILGDGDPQAQWMFVFDTPIARDIEQQKLITGRAGQLFDSILLALSLARKDVYLSSIFKCPPAADVSASMPQCADLLQHQITLVQPKVIIALGEFVAQSLIKTNDNLEQLREQPQKHFEHSVVIMPTYSLPQMLETPALKAKVWQDLKSALKLVAN